MGTPTLQDSGHTGPVPPANRPGHHPDTEQDKPDLGQRFELAFDPKLGLLSRLLGVHPGNADVHVDRSTLRIRFGRWSLETPRDNVAEVHVTGPYSWWKVAGPPRLSFADRGITFATNAARGVCISFHEPVPAALPTSLLRHPAVTVTPADPDGLVEALAG